MKTLLPPYTAKFLDAVSSQQKELLIKQIAYNGGKMELPTYWVPEWPIVHDMLRDNDKRIEFFPETPNNNAWVRLNPSIYSKNKRLKVLLKGE